MTRTFVTLSVVICLAILTAAILAYWLYGFTLTPTTYLTGLVGAGAGLRWLSMNRLAEAAAKCCPDDADGRPGCWCPLDCTCKCTGCNCRGDR